ncbi:MAG: SURF1 family protein, partial [Legionella sp.]|nr:SURF1 family protein [Legionella sp.]
MPSLTCFKFRFTPNWFMTALAALFISLFTGLGFWQIQRADEKKQMVEAQQHLLKQESVAWSTRQNVPQQYQRIHVQGRYLPTIFLLDNQHQRHQFGYDVLSPLLMDDGSVVMVDRGWIPGDGNRQLFPRIFIPKEKQKVAGSVYFPNMKQWILGVGLEEKENKMVIIERIDTKLVSQVLQKKVYPFIIRLDKQDAYGFVREWAIVSMPPQRHIAYALQWFAMALVILIIFVALNLK